MDPIKKVTYSDIVKDKNLTSTTYPIILNVESCTITDLDNESIHISVEEK